MADIDPIEVVAKRVGGKMDLMLDALNYYSTFADALNVGRTCDEAGFYWIEDPYWDVVKSLSSGIKTFG